MPSPSRALPYARAAARLVVLVAAFGGTLAEARSPAPAPARAEEVGRLNRAISKLRRSGTQASAKALLELIGTTRDDRLRRFGLGALLENRQQLSSRQRRQVEAVRRELFERTPDLPDRGLIHVSHMSGPEFYADELKAYRRGGFSVEELSGKRAVAKRGRLRVVIRRGDERIFRDMGDPKTNIVIYSGHSNVGGVVDASLAASPSQRGKKLLLLLQCVGTQTLPMVRARYHGAQIITTKRPSYDTEDFNLVQSMYNGLERGETWASIRQRASRNESSSNYLLPNEKHAIQHGDLDGDGRLDFGGQRHGDRRFDLLKAADRRAAAKLLMAVGYLNQMHHYHTEENKPAVFSKAEAEGRFRSGGVVESTTTHRVTDIVVRKEGDRKISEVRLHSRFAREPKWFVEAAAAFEMHLHLMRSLRGAATHRDRLRATVFAGDYLLRFAPDRDKCDAAIRKLARMHGLGKVTWKKLEPVLLVEPDKTATERQLDLLDQALGGRRPGLAIAP